MSDETTTNYSELSKQGYGLFIDAYATANQSALGYAKSLYEIVSRPYASTAVETTVRENFDRANQLISLTVTQLQTAGQKQAELAEKLAAYTSKVQEASLTGARGLWKTALSNASYAKETADAQLDGFVKRVDDMQARVATTMAASVPSKN